MCTANNIYRTVCLFSCLLGENISSIVNYGQQTFSFVINGKIYRRSDCIVIWNRNPDRSRVTRWKSYFVTWLSIVRVYALCTSDLKIFDRRHSLQTPLSSFLDRHRTVHCFGISVNGTRSVKLNKSRLHRLFNRIPRIRAKVV